MSPLTHSPHASVYPCRWVGESLASGPQHLSGSETSQLPWRWRERIWVSALNSWFNSEYKLSSILINWLIWEYFKFISVHETWQHDNNCTITRLQQSSFYCHIQVFSNHFVHCRLSAMHRNLKKLIYHLNRENNKRQHKRKINKCFS